MAAKRFFPSLVKSKDRRSVDRCVLFRPHPALLRQAMDSGTR